MDGELFTGKIRVNPRRRHEAYVSVEGFPPTADVKLEGFRAQNRVIEGDVVVIRLDDVSAWPGLDDRGGGASGTDEDGADLPTRPEAGSVVTFFERAVEISRPPLRPAPQRNARRAR